MSKKSSVDSDNYYLYPEWFEGGNESNQSQPSTSSHSYPTLEYIWSNAVRLTRTTHSNLQDEIEYIEANLGGGNKSCNCSELQYGIDRNSTKIYYNSVNITSNANKIVNLSDIKLSRDGSQPMEGELVCNSGIKTNTITTISESVLDCQKHLQINKYLIGKVYDGLWLFADSFAWSPRVELDAHDAGGGIRIKTCGGGVSLIPRIDIPGNSEFVNIKFADSNLLPYSNNYQNLGNSSHRWKKIYAIEGDYSGVIIPDAINSNSTKIYHNSVNITSNADKIENLSNIKLSRDGSQPMEGELTCNSGLKTDIIKARTESIIDCQNQLRVYQSLGGDGDYGLWLGSDFSLGAPSINLYPYGSSANGKIFIKTPRSDGVVVPRIEIPGKEDLVDIKIWESNIIPYDDNYQDLGSESSRWKNVYAVTVNSSNISNLEERVEYLEENLSSNVSCNCSALEYSIQNLSKIKLSRDGSQSMTGLLKCESGLETNTIAPYSGDIIECTDNLKLDGDIVGDSTDGLNLIAEDTNMASRIQLTPGSSSKILLGTFSGQSVVPRIEIPEGSGNIDITVRGAHLVPYADNSQNLGSSSKRWKELNAVKGIFSETEMKSRIWSNSTFTIGHGTSSDDLTQIMFTSTDLSLRTPNSGNVLTDRISLTGGVDDSIIYIKNAHLLPYDNLSSYLGSTTHRWIEVFANRGSFTHINAISESTLDIEDDVKIAQKLWGKDNLILAGGDPTTGHSQIQIYNESYIGLPDGIKIFTTNTSKELEERVRIWGNTDYCFTYFGSDVLPLDDDVYDIGGPSLRWSDIYAVNTHWGDLGFVENVCPKCNKKFKIGDNIVLKVVRFSEEDNGIMTIPIHLECTRLPAKTIKRKYPIKEKYYEWDERQGKIVTKWRVKKEKKKIKKKILKPGYRINQKTGKIETINQKEINLSEAIEEIEEEIEATVYQEKEIKI